MVLRLAADDSGLPYSDTPLLFGVPSHDDVDFSGWRRRQLGRMSHRSPKTRGIVSVGP